MFSLCVALSSPVLAPANSSWLCLLKSGVYLTSLFLCHDVEILFRKLGEAIIGLTSFDSPFSGVSLLHCLKSSILQIIVSFILSTFGCLTHKSRSETCDSILAGSRSSLNLSSTFAFFCLQTLSSNLIGGLTTLFLRTPHSVIYLLTFL